MVKAGTTPQEQIMNTPHWTEEHSRVVADATPDVPAADDLELARTWATIRRGLPVGTTAGRRRARLVVGSALTAATLAVGGVAAAGGFSAHTGTYSSDAEDVRLAGPGEWLDPVAADFGGVITNEIADIPFASDADRAAVVGNLVADGRRDAADPTISSRVSTGEVRAWSAQGAICGWAEQWADATLNGDTARRDAAIGKLGEASTWKAVTDIDPKQRTGTKKTTARDLQTGKTRNLIVDDSTQFAYLSTLQKLARGTDVEEMDAATSQLYCYSVATPHLSVTNERNHPNR
jgi:hypothetical protein